MDTTQFAAMWRRQADDIEKDRHSQAPDYREASVLRRCADEIEETATPAAAVPSTTARSAP